MQKGKRKRGDQSSRPINDTANENRSESVIEQLKLESIEPNNNYIDETKDPPPATSLEMDDLVLDMTMQPETRVIIHDAASIAGDTHQNNCSQGTDGMTEIIERKKSIHDPASIAGDTHQNNCSQETDAMPEIIETKKSRIRQQSKIILRKIVIESKPTQINDNPPSGTNISSDSQVQTIISNPKPKGRGRGRPKKLIKQEKILGNNFSIKTREMPSCNRVETTSEAGKEELERDFICQPGTSMQEKLMQSELIEMNSNPESESKGTPLDYKVPIDLTSKTTQRRPKYLCKPRGGRWKKVIKSKEWIMDDNSRCESTTTISSVSLPGMETTSDEVKPKRKRGPNLGTTRRKKIIESKPMMNNNPECETEDTSSVTCTETDLVSEISTTNTTSTYLCENKRRGKKVPRESEPMNISINSGLESNDTSLTTETQIVSALEKSKPKTKRTRKSRTKIPEPLITPEPMDQAEMNLGSEINDTLIFARVKTDVISEAPKPKPKRIRKPRTKAPKQLVTPQPVDQVGISSARKNEDILSATEVQTDLISETPKPKPKRIRKSRAKAPKQLITPQPVDQAEINPARNNEDTLSATRVQIDIISEKPKPKAKRIRKSKVETPKEMIMDSGCVTNNAPSTTEVQDTLSATQVQVDVISEKPKPKAKRIRKSKVETPKEMIMDSGCVTNNALSTTEVQDTLSATQVQIDVMSETPKPKAKRIRKSKVEALKELINTSGCETNNTPSITEVQTNLISQVTISKKKRVRGGKSEEPKVQMKSDTSEATNETNDVSDKLTSSITKSEIKPEGGTSKILKNPEKLGMDTDPANETVCVRPKICPQIDSVSKTLEIKDTNYNSEKIPQEVQFETVLQSTRTNDDRINKTEDISLENHNLCYSVSKTIENKYLLPYELKVSLCDIAYSEELTSKQREMLLKNNQSPQKCPNTKNILDLSPSTSTQQSTSHDIITASVELMKRNDDPIENVPSTKACEYEHSNPRKRKSGRKKDTKTESEISSQKRWNILCKSKLSLRGPGTNSSVASESDVLSSVGRTVPSIQHKFGSPSTGLTQQNDPREKLTESTVSPDEHALMWPDEMMELGIPLNLSIRDLEKSMSPQTVFSKPNVNTTGEIHFGTNIKHQSRDKNVDPIGFGSSTFNVTDLSTSFTEIDNAVVCIASVNDNQQAPSRPNKLPCKNTVSVRVSLPAEHYLKATQKQSATHKKFKTVMKEKKPAPQKTQTHTKTNNSNQRRSSKNTKSSTSDKKPEKISSMSAETEKSVGVKSNRCEESPNLLSDAACVQETTLERCNTGIIDIPPAPEHGVSDTFMQPIISDVRSLPRIVNDKLLPKGTITLSSISCKSIESNNLAIKEENESCSTNINETDKVQQIRGLTIHKQNTYASIANVSQSKPIAHSSNQADALADMENMNVGIDAVDNSCEFKNPDSVKSSETNFPETVRIHGTHQSFVVQQHFDSAQLWKICPELAEYFSHDDIVNNNSNNDDKSSNCDNLDTVETNGKNNSVRELSGDMEIGGNENNDAHLPSHDENLNNRQNVSRDMVAGNIDPTEMEVESSEFTRSIESHPPRRSVIANLTTDNLRNFNNISNNNGKGGLWAEYLSHGDITKATNAKPIEGSYGAITESTSESLKEFYQVDSKKRKRKWIENEKNTDCKPMMKAKKLKLDRNRWSNETHYIENMTNSSRLTFMGSINSDNSVIPSVNENTQSPEKNTHAEANVVEETVTHEPTVPLESKEESQNECDNEPEESDQKLSRETDEKENIRISTPIPVDNASSEASKHEFGNDDRPEESQLCITFPQSTKADDSNNGVDNNGNFTSMSPPSSSSSSKSSGSNSNLNRSTHSEKSVKDNPENNEEQKTPCENQCEKQEEEPADEDDGDCISLFAESLFTNFDQATNIEEGATFSPLYDPSKEPGDKFQEMTDVGAYFDKNVEECNKAYEFCAEEENNMHNNPCLMADTLTNANHGRMIPQLEEENVNQMNRIGQNLYHSNIRSLKDRLGEKRAAANTPLPTPYLESFFHGHCFGKLRRGLCTRETCHFRHQLSSSLQNIEENEPSLILAIIDYAISTGYIYFIRHVYRQIIEVMDYANIIKIFIKLTENDLMAEHLVRITISVIQKIHISLSEFLRDIARLINENDDVLGELILRTFHKFIEPGTYWQTFRGLLVRMKPLNVSVSTVIAECVCNKDKSQIEDVYVNYVGRLTVEQVSSINVNLRRQFDLLLVENNLIHEPKHSDEPTSFEYVNTADHRITEPAINVLENNHKDINGIPTILSPDDTAHYNYDNLLQLSPASRQLNHKSGSNERLFSARRSLTTKNQDIVSNATANNEILFDDQGQDVATEVDSVVKQDSTDSLNINMVSEPGPANPSSIPYMLHPIDDLPPPQSAFRDRHWKFHLAMNNFKEALKHREYQFALKILNKYSDTEQTLYMSSCYKMLRQNVMASAHHVKKLIELSVLMRANEYLNETLFNLGMYMMIELCNNNAWVLAYSLYKSLQYTASSTTNNTAEFALISAEICIANGRPLKAFNILKQNNMLRASRSKWNVISNANEEYVRVMIIDLLLDALCQDYPDRAFYIFTYLLIDQTRIYHPVDLTAHIDELATGILNRKCNDLTTELGRLIIENNFTLKNSVFQSLVVNVFQNDKPLCRKLYRYGTWIGIYPIVKSTLPLHILIKTNWRKEEMYLVVIDFLEKLSMDIGHAVDRIGVNQFSIHLVFELAPFEQHRPANNGQISNKDELKMSKELMKTVLREQFNPPLRTVIAEKERFMKLQSRSVVNYLRSMLVEQ